MEPMKGSAEEMVIMPLGGGQEVGRSCIILQYQGRNIMLDCGCHPGREGSDGLPFFDSLDNPADIDLVLVTHFHIDHCAALPYFTEKTNFKGRIFMTHASKAVMKLLLSDNIRLQHRSAPLYSEQDLQNCIDKIEVVDYHETVEYKGIKFTATAAGHVLGAAMFMIDIDGIRVLYTGDYSLEEDRHLFGAQVPPGGPPDVMIVESTFGTSDLPSRASRELAFTHAVQDIVTRGGSCLIPVFALGRAQELLLILDEHWQEHAHLQSVPIFYASKLATKSLRVYQTFINMMNDHVREQMDQFNNPFKLKHIKSIHNQSDFAMLGPCVVMASPGFMQSGVSRQLFEAWCDDPRHGVVIAGYTIEGTLANDLLSAPTEVKCLDNRIKPLRCQVEHISFSAHVDYTENKTFIKSVMPDYIILVHGEKTQMKRLKDGLEADMRKNLWPTQHKPSVAMPENGVRVRLRFRKTVVADVVGSAATALLEQLDGAGESLSEAEGQAGSISVPQGALLVTENFTSKLVVASELANHTSCKFGTITERLTVPVPQGLEVLVGVPSSGSDKSNDSDAGARVMDLLMCHLEEVFEELSLNSGSKDAKSGELTGAAPTITVQSLVTLHLGYANTVSDYSGTARRPTHVLVEWTGSPVADTVADCVAGLVMQAFSAFSSLRRTVLPGGGASSSSSKRRHKRQRTDKEVDAASNSAAPAGGAGATAVKTEHGVAEDKSADLIDRMIKGEVDPSKRLALQQETSATKLRALKDLVEHSAVAGEWFAEVKLNADGDKLIFLGRPGMQYEVADDSVKVCPKTESTAMDVEVESGIGAADEACAEAFVFVKFAEPSGGAEDTGAGEHAGDHHAVVHCADDGFRRAVMLALKMA